MQFAVMFLVAISSASVCVQVHACPVLSRAQADASRTAARRRNYEPMHNTHSLTRTLLAVPHFGKASNAVLGSIVC
jgi:hypothetical protein